MKKCSLCKETKGLECFPKDNRVEDGRRNKCKECDNKRRRELHDKDKESVRKKKYYKENKKEISERQKKYYKKNKKEILKRNKEWEKNNYEKRKAARSKPEQRKKRREWENNYKSNRRKTDPLFKLSDTIRNGVARVTRAVKQQKELHSLEYLGCSLEEFKSHIESLWLDGMSWENHRFDGWHIDHKVPLDYFVKNSDDPWVANHYTNLQPLWAEDNHQKSNKLQVPIQSV